MLIVLYLNSHEHEHIRVSLSIGEAENLTAVARVMRASTADGAHNSSIHRVKFVCVWGEKRMFEHAIHTTRSGFAMYIKVADVENVFLACFALDFSHVIFFSS